jgi:hypothetical protein
MIRCMGKTGSETKARGAILSRRMWEKGGVATGGGILE